MNRRVLRSWLWNAVAAGLLLMLAAGCIVFAVGGSRPVGVESILVTSLGARRIAVAKRHVDALNELIRIRGYS